MIDDVTHACHKHVSVEMVCWANRCVQPGYWSHKYFNVLINVVIIQIKCIIMLDINDKNLQSNKFIRDTSHTYLSNNENYQIVSPNNNHTKYFQMPFSPEGKIWKKIVSLQLQIRFRTLSWFNFHDVLDVIFVSDLSFGLIGNSCGDTNIFWCFVFMDHTFFFIPFFFKESTLYNGYHHITVLVNMITYELNATCFIAWCPMGLIASTCMWRNTRAWHWRMEIHIWHTLWVTPLMTMWTD